MRFPPLPKTLQAPGGEVRIELATAVLVDGKDAYGSWDASTRRIQIDRGQSRAHQWHTLFHEMTHVMLSDSGCQELMNDGMNEALCEANATARMRERFG